MGKGSFFRQVIASVMRVLGVVGLIVAGVGCVVAIVTGFEASGATGIGGIALGAAWVISAIAALEILFYRGDRTDELPDSGYAVLSVFSQILRAIGEVAAVYGVVMGLGAGFAAWIADAFVAFGPSGFVAGVTVFAMSVTVGFVTLFATYFMAECVNLIVNIANNSKRIAVSTSAEHPASEQTRIGERDQAAG
jgi:hypothetical protein